MRSSAVVVVAAAVAVAVVLAATEVRAAVPAFHLGPLPNGGENWALLVAGSSGWDNYRHQADVCHSYQVLHAHGIPDDHIVVMMYDDIANNFENKAKGTIINVDNGPNVYAGVPKDYVKSAVLPDTFLQALQGLPTKGGSGKVIKSGPNDRVFVFFADHGAPGLLAFPDGSGIVSHVLHANDLLTALKNMAAQKKFYEMVLYIEACESGSMFNGLLPDNLKIYATTAATPFESSYACDMNDHLGVYLSDCYSFNWMNDTDHANVRTETLDQQFQIVRRVTTTSTVCEYGDLSVKKEPIGNFQAPAQTQDTYRSGAMRVPSADAVRRATVPVDDRVASSRDVRLSSLKHRLRHAETPARRAKLLREIEAEEKHRARSDAVIEAIAARVMELDTVAARYFVKQAMSPPVSPNDQCQSETPLPAACLKETFGMMESACGKFSDYSLGHVTVLRDLCLSGASSDEIGRAARSVCAAF